MGICELCGPNLLSLCPNEDFSFEWKGYKKVKTWVSRAGKDQHYNKVTPICNTVKIFLRFFKKVLGDFITDNYVA
jgi:hypothetical protein